LADENRWVEAAVLLKNREAIKMKKSHRTEDTFPISPSPKAIKPFASDD